MADVERIRKNLNILDEKGASIADINSYLKMENITSDWVKENIGMDVISDSDTFLNNLRLVGQGASLGLADEIVGAGRGVYDSLTSDIPMKKAIDQGIDAERKNIKQFRGQYPKRAFALEMGGGLATGGLGAARVGALKAGQTLGRKMINSSKVGIPLGAASGAGYSEGGFDEEGLKSRGLGSSIGATTGLAFGTAIPLVTKIGTGIAKSVGRLLPKGAEYQAKGWMRNAAEQDGLTADAAKKAMDKMPEEAMIADVGGEEIKGLARNAATRFGGKEAAERLGQRQDAQGYRIAGSVDKNLSDTPLEDFIEETTKQRRLTANKNYAEVYSKEMPLNEGMKNLLQNKQFQKVYEKARGLAEYEGVNLPDAFQATGKGAVFAKPDVRTLDYMKQALDDQINRLYRKGANTEAGKAKELRNNLRDLMDEAIPEYKKARSVYAGYAAAEEAAEVGRKFITSPTKVSPKVLNKMGEHEKEALKIGVADALRNKILSTQDGADVVKKIFGNKLARQRLEQIWGDKNKFANFEQTMKNEAKMHDTYSRINVGSRTGLISKDDETFKKAADGIGDAMNVFSGNPIPLLSQFIDKAKPPPEAVAKHLSRYLLNPNPQARAEALRIISNAPRLRQAGRLPSAALPSGLGIYGGGQAAERLSPEVAPFFNIRKK